jgi:hypothetical protein
LAGERWERRTPPQWDVSGSLQPAVAGRNGSSSTDAATRQVRHIHHTNSGIGLDFNVLQPGNAQPRSCICCNASPHALHLVAGTQRSFQPPGLQLTTQVTQSRFPFGTSAYFSLGTSSKGACGEERSIP